MSQPLSLIDSHAHIQGKEHAADLDGVLMRADEAGVKKIVVVGGAGDLSSNLQAIELAKSHDPLFATIGMHPHDAKDVGSEELKSLRELLRAPKVVAVGETGLDFYYDHSPRPVQEKIFGHFIELALETALPLIVHNRDSDRRVEEIILHHGEGKVRGVIHCFTSDYASAKKFLELGFYISFSGILTFKTAEPLRAVAKKLPLEKLMVETDSPFLTPIPHRGKRNEPAFVRLVAETLAKTKEVTLEEVAAATSKNSEELFGI